MTDSIFVVSLDSFLEQLFRQILQSLFVVGTGKHDSCVDDTGMHDSHRLQVGLERVSDQDGLTVDVFEQLIMTLKSGL